MLLVLRAILPSFGFEASEEGMQDAEVVWNPIWKAMCQEMIQHCCGFFQDPEVESH